MAIFHEPNRKGPRYRRNLKKVINQDFLKRLKKAHPEISLTNKEVRLIIDTFHQLCKNVICETRDGLELPEQLGCIMLGAFKPKNPLMNERKAAMYKKTFPIPGWLCKIYYSNYSSKYKFANSQFWGFEAGRTLKKQASQNFIKQHKLYVILDNHIKLNRIYYEANDKVREIVKKNLEQQKLEE